MHCERCHKAITDQTVRIYAGRCVPCHRRRFSQRFPRILKATLAIVGRILFSPFWLVRDLVGVIRLWLTPLPFTRREVMALMAPVHGRSAARTYFRGLRAGFLDGVGLSGIFFFSQGMIDGCQIQRDLSQWPGIVQRRASKPIKLNHTPL